ncbi:TraR/DksA C4-type zinc finger protein [Streptomyces sp. TR02-1]|uniref:TraR/DksA family transcriptional regulator n=1 Tax=Streptomyces sp. TR02-1 TaxID=3385977 RepID=UPI0039A15BAA
MVARKSAAKQASPKKPAAKRTPARKAASGETPAAKKTPAKKAAPTAAKRPSAKRAAAKKAPDGKTPPTKAAAKKAPVKKTTAKKTTPKKTVAKKTVARKAAASTARPRRAAGGTSPATASSVRTTPKKTGARKVAAKKTPAAEAPEFPTARSAQSAPAKPGELPVRPGEDPWTPEEVEEARLALREESEQLRGEIDASEEALSGLMRDSGDTAGDDDADTGTRNITREHEMALAANAREMLYQTGRALERIEAGTYGLCENCGRPIGKARMQAFPRATLCVECKQKQERR